jgi:cytochrome c
MKKTVTVLTVLVFFIACGNNDASNTTSETKKDTAPPEAQMSPEAEKAEQLIAQSGCLQCHKVAEALTGPAYEAVAAKYPDNDQVVDSLANKVVNGGAGNWGTVPMPPNPLPKEDARANVKYILSLK